MPISQLGALNTTALIVPDLYVQIVPPQTTLLNGVPTDVLGIVGTAQWGPVGLPVTLATMSDYASSFGQLQNRKYDLGTATAAAILQGAANIRGVRVTDGTDLAASATITATGGAVGLTLAAKYSGSLGNSLVWNLGTGSSSTNASPTWRLVLSLPGQLSEVYDNIGGSGAQLWTALAAALNLGNGPLRGPSQLVIAAAGAATAAPAAGSGGFTGGTDGAGAVTAATLVGVDILPRRGMYALRGTGASVAFLADADDSTQWSLQVQFGLSEGVYMILTGPAGDTIPNAVATKQNAGIDNYSAKLLFGDWIYWNDAVCYPGLSRIVPQCPAKSLVSLSSSG